jgi:hypothetical protein
MELTGLNRQAKAADRTSTAKHSLDGRREAADSNFRNSLRAYFDIPDSEDEGHKSVDGAANLAYSSSQRQAVMDPSENANQKRGSANSTADDAGPGQKPANKMDRNARAQLTVPPGAQKRLLNIKEHQPLGFTAGGAKKSALDESTSNKANGFDSATEVVLLPTPAAAISSPSPGGAAYAIPVFSSDETVNGSSASVAQANSPGASSPSLNSRVTAEEQIASDAWQVSNAENQSAVTHADESALIQGTNDAAFAEPELDRGVTAQVHSPELSIRETAPSTRLIEPAGKSEPTDELASIDKSDPDTGVNQTTSISSGQAVASSQLPTISTAENQDSRAPSFQNVSGNLAQSPSEADSHEVPRDLNRSAESSVTVQTVGSTNAVGSDGKSKSSSSRFAAGSSVRIHKQDPPSSSGALASHSPNLAATTEATNAVSTPQKAIDAFSNDSRLQDTFTALESVSRNETGSFHWTRTGPTQAEAGYQDPALGWIRVRAESSGGVLHATLVPSSSDSAQALSGHMAGLHTYLAENRTPVETLTLASLGGNVQQFAGQDSRQGTHQGAGQQAEESNVPEPALELRSNGRSTHSASQDRSISNPVFTRSNSVSGNAGVHISVIA